MPQRYVIEDHTADVGLRAYGGTPEELFANAAAGMFDILCDLSLVRPRDACAVSLEAEDAAYLLADWLQELLYLHETRRVLFARFDVASVRLDAAAGAARLEAKALGEPIDLSRHELRTQIKAVTCHSLEVKRRDGGWTAHVLFDL